MHVYGLKIANMFRTFVYKNLSGWSCWTGPELLNWASASGVRVTALSLLRYLLGQLIPVSSTVLPYSSKTHKESSPFLSTKTKNFSIVYSLLLFFGWKKKKNFKCLALLSRKSILIYFNYLFENVMWESIPLLVRPNN